MKIHDKLLAVFISLVTLHMLWAQVQHIWDRRAVVGEVHYVLNKLPGVTELAIAWENVRDCQFLSLTALQGDADTYAIPRYPIELDTVVTGGSRGAGHHAVRLPWLLIKPAAFSYKNGDDFMLIARHDCGVATITSKMIVTDIRNVFDE